MALIVATGSNLGDRLELLAQARERLCARWHLVAASRVYLSPAVDYEAQPEFANQVLQFALPWQSASAVMRDILDIEREMGRVRDIPRGPRLIDIDILFWGLDKIRLSDLVVPHPRWHERSFVVRPLMELPFFHAIEKCFTIPGAFQIEATPIES